MQLSHPPRGSLKSHTAIGTYCTCTPTPNPVGLCMRTMTTAWGIVLYFTFPCSMPFLGAYVCSRKDEHTAAEHAQ